MENDMAPKKKTLREQILMALAKGDVVDENGSATAVLAQTLNAASSSISAKVGQMAHAGEIEREMQGKRTYRIALSENAQKGHTTPSREATQAVVGTPRNLALIGDAMIELLRLRDERISELEEALASANEKLRRARQERNADQLARAALERRPRERESEIQPRSEEDPLDRLADLLERILGEGRRK